MRIIDFSDEIDYEDVIAIGYDEGERCNRHDCCGTIQLADVENCSCHLGRAPCAACTNVETYCPECGWKMKYEEGIDLPNTKAEYEKREKESKKREEENKKREEEKVKVVTCLNNIGMEENFDKDVEYIWCCDIDKEFINVEDRFGKKIECSKDRFSKIKIEN